jgi:dTDP-4-dehydrorhamnose 3,5-epimerase
MALVAPAREIGGVIVVDPKVFSDARGIFVETFRQEWLAPDAPMMVQGNRADRSADTLVGLHYHRFQADYWYVPRGRVLAALFDLRVSSPTRGVSLTVELNDETHRGLYIPRGVAHGFYAITDVTLTYLVDGYYNPADELGVAWNDPVMGIEWPGESPTLSERDRANPLVADLAADMLPG